MIEILSATFQTAIREEAWNRNFRSQVEDAEIEEMRYRNDARQRWNRITAQRSGSRQISLKLSENRDTKP